MERLSLSRERVGLTMGAPGARSQGPGVLGSLHLILKAKGSPSEILNLRNKVCILESKVHGRTRNGDKGAISEQEKE